MAVLLRPAVVVAVVAATGIRRFLVAAAVVGAGRLCRVSDGDT